MIYTSSFLLFVLPLILSTLSTLLLIIFRKGALARAVISITNSFLSLTILVLSLICLINNEHFNFALSIGILPYTHYVIPWPLYRIVFRIDALSAIFLLMLGIVALAASIYSYSYLEKYDKEYRLDFFGINYTWFITLMYLVIVVADIFWFLVFWELMTLFSQFLVSYEYRRKKAVTAGEKYFILTKAFAELMIIGAIVIILIGASGATSFSAISSKFKLMLYSSYPLAQVALAMFFTGLMVKAALVPLHSWLPEAHPEAPSNVSALLSGVMIKVSVYMMFRLFLFFSRPSLLWGLVISSIGTVTLIYGTMMALRQIDSKRLLAYHSIGQIGYVVLGLGACITLLSMSPSRTYLAAIAAIGALYHALNHAIFKSLLFLNAGAVEFATGTRNLNVLGGLSKVMPYTALTALIASFSISGIPPFNGFVSKWFLYVSTIPVKSYLPIFGFAAMFISSVTTASFMKLYTSIYGRPARKPLNDVKKPSFSMIFSMAILAFLCVLFGVVPFVPLRLISPAIHEVHIVKVDFASLIPHVLKIAMNPSIVIASIVFPIFGIIYTILIGNNMKSIKGWLCGRGEPIIKAIPVTKYYFEEFEEVFSEIYILSDALYAGLQKFSKVIGAFLNKFTKLSESPIYMAFIACLIVFLLLIIGLATGCLPG